jgi:hypothetical protein
MHIHQHIMESEEAFKITWALVYIVSIIESQKYKLLFSYYKFIF